MVKQCCVMKFNESTSKGSNNSIVKISKDITYMFKYDEIDMMFTFFGE